MFHDTTRLYYFSSNVNTFDQNVPSKCKFSDFSLLKLNFIKFFLSFFKQKVSFSLNFELLFSVMRDNSSVLFLAETVHDLDKVHNFRIKVHNFRISTAHVKFHQICILIDSLKYIKFQQGSTEKLYPMTLKIDAKFEKTP